MASLSLAGCKARATELFPGVVASVVVGAAASYLAEHYATPRLLLALLLGMAMYFLAEEGKCKPGIEFAARNLLRIGVALLGLRISLEQIVALGWEPLVMVLATVVLVISVSVVVARLMGFDPLFGMLTGGATAICGASAALALSAALPPHPNKERATLFTVIGVSALSTLAMILYPMIARSLELDPQAAGVFLGGTIHDVAQVVGAGYSMGSETGDTATVVKLMRVAMLLPVILCAVLITRRRATEGVERPPLLPWFAVGFALLAGINSTGVVPVSVQSLGGDLSQALLVISIAALGMKTRLQELVSVGLKPILLMIGESLFLIGLVLFFIS